MINTVGPQGLTAPLTTAAQNLELQNYSYNKLSLDQYWNEIYEKYLPKFVF